MLNVVDGPEHSGRPWKSIPQQRCMARIVAFLKQNFEFGDSVERAVGLHELVVHALQSLKDLRVLAEEGHHVQGRPAPQVLYI